MNTFNKISSLSGFATLTFNAGNSPLSVGEVATHIPFKGLFGESFKGIGVRVSDKKMDGIIRRQNDEFKRTKNNTVLPAWKPKEPQQFHSTTVTLLKNVNNDTFQTKLTPQVVEFITGKKSVWKNKGYELPKLSLEEIVVCTLAEFALDKFHTLNGLELKCSFYEGGEVVWSSKY